MSEYKCESHKLDLACSGCIRAHIAKKDKLLEFVKKIHNEPYQFDELSHVSWDATELLKEIGEI